MESRASSREIALVWWEMVVEGGWCMVVGGWWLVVVGGLEKAMSGGSGEKSDEGGRGDDVSVIWDVWQV